MSKQYRNIVKTLSKHCRREAKRATPTQSHAQHRATPTLSHQNPTENQRATPTETRHPTENQRARESKSILHDKYVDTLTVGM